MLVVKWLIFIVAVVASYPMGRVLQQRPGLRRHAWMLVGFLPFLDQREMGLVIFWGHLGDTAGIEVTPLDWLALSLYFANARPARPLPFRFALTVYLLIATVSVAQAEWVLAAFGYVWKLCRMYLLYASVFRASRDKRVAQALLRGLMLGIIYESVWVVWQHFGLRIHQATGTFVHQNTLGILANLIVMAPIALILAGRATMLPKLAVIAAVPTCLFTVSRGALLFFGIGSVLVYLISTFRRYTLRKVAIGFVGLVAAVALIQVALATLSSRDTAQQDESMKSRERLEASASLMLKEHPLGVGPNHFTMMLLRGGYGERAGVPWYERTAIVHNIYLLTVAEMGYAGLIGLVMLFIAPLPTAFRYCLRARRDHRGDVLAAYGVALSVFYAHCFFEWVWRRNEVMYVYFMIVGITASLARQLREER
jgi:O-antigen ligase